MRNLDSTKKSDKKTGSQIEHWLFREKNAKSRGHNILANSKEIIKSFFFHDKCSSIIIRGLIQSTFLSIKFFYVVWF